MSIVSFFAKIFGCCGRLSEQSEERYTPPPEKPGAYEAVEQEIAEFQKNCNASNAGGGTQFSFVRKEKKNNEPNKEKPSGVSPQLWGAVFAETGLAPSEKAARHRRSGSALGVSFAAELTRYVRERFAGKASLVYRTANLSRQTYSAIISDEEHRVARGTALALAFSLHLTEDEAQELLEKAGYSLSSSLLGDVIFRCCLRHGVVRLETLNELLQKYHCPPLP